MPAIFGRIGKGATGEGLAAFFRLAGLPGKPADLVEWRGDDATLAVARPGALARSADGRWVCGADGEVFGRTEQENGRPTADVEETSKAALAAFLSPGRQALASLRGAFVFWAYDTLTRTLALGRDRYGNKTLYYSSTPSGFVFSSSLAAVARSGWACREIGAEGLLFYLSGGFVPAPHTIYKNIFLLEPGEGLLVNEHGARRERFARLEPEAWSIPDDSRSASEDDLASRLESLLLDAIRIRLPRSGPVAVYLSGGRDTTLLTGLLRRHTDRDVTTFTLGLGDSPNDESGYARTVAKHFDVDHRLHRLQADEFFDTIEELPLIFGQPFADVSAIPTFVIARQAADGFDRIFSGDGPDFMLGNFDFRLLHAYYRWMPARSRPAVSAMADGVIRAFFRKWISPNLSVPELLRQPAFFWIYQKKFKAAALEELLMRPVQPSEFPSHRFLSERSDIPVSERLLLAEQLYYGMDDVLCKATSIHNAWQMRLLRPFYDQPVFQFCRDLPTGMKFRHGRGRHLQNRLLARYVPHSVIYRPKRGFIVDFVEFGEARLKALADHYLTRRRLAETGLIHPDVAIRCVQEYFAGNRKLGPKMWVLLMFEIWRERF